MSEIDKSRYARSNGSVILHYLPYYTIMDIFSFLAHTSQLVSYLNLIVIHTLRFKVLYMHKSEMRGDRSIRLMI